MNYKVINLEKHRVEAIYNELFCAELLARNFDLYYKGQYTFIIQPDRNPLEPTIITNDRPTQRQLWRIVQIESQKGIQFTGLTKWSARNFIGLNI